MKISFDSLFTLSSSLKNARNVLDNMARNYFIDIVREFAADFPVQVKVAGDALYVVPEVLGLMPIWFPLSNAAWRRLQENGLPGIFETFLNFRKSLLEGEEVDEYELRRMVHSEIYFMPK